MSKGLLWFRMYAEFATDPDVQSLDFGDQRHYAMLLCLKCAGTLDKDYPSDERRLTVICRALGLDRIAAGEAHRRLGEAGLIDPNWHPTGWARRQFQSDVSTDRVRRHRGKRNGDETFQDRFSNGDVTAPDTDTDTDTDIPPTDPSGRSPPGAHAAEYEPGGTKGQPAKSRATRLPDDFTLTLERTAIAAAEKLPNPERVFEKFRNYWHAKSGQQARKVDWDATWRNWCMTEADRSRAPVPRQRGGLSPGSTSTPWRPG